MKVDFSRDTFKESADFLRVLMQQGRVHIDADWNEQASIILHFLQTLATDVIGPHGGPGFEVIVTKNDGTNPESATTTGVKVDRAKIELLDIKRQDKNGFYYVKGNRVRDYDQLLWDDGESPKSPIGVILDNVVQVVYLDVWEKTITQVQNDDIREKALNGPDTCSRSKLVAQVKRVQTDLKAAEINGKGGYELFLKDLGIGSNPPTRSDYGTGTGRMNAKVTTSERSSDPCVLSPDSRYRGQENQLYRVEIHTPGPAGAATFKWSRENGSVVLPIRTAPTVLANSNEITLEHLPRDYRLGLKNGDWIEVVDDDVTDNFIANNLFKVTSVSENDLQIVIEGTATVGASLDLDKHPLLRRWDQVKSKNIELTKGGVVMVEEGRPIELENGIVIDFVPPKPDGGGNADPRYYRTGDYWLIPARVATGNIEWEETDLGQLPRGIQHYFAPLVHIKDAGAQVELTDLRKPIKD